MLNPFNPDNDKHSDYDEREKAMHQSEWLVEITSYAQLGLAIASFNKQIGNESFIGTAEMKVQDGIRTLEISLCFDETEVHRCAICNKIPVQPSLDNPAICTFCGNKICKTCWKKHELSHWRPQRTIGGEEIPF